MIIAKQLPLFPHENPTQPSRESSQTQGNAAQVPGEAPFGTGGISPAMELEQPGQESPLSEELEAQTPACEVNGNIWMQHEQDWLTGRCTRCGWQFPPILSGKRP